MSSPGSLIEYLQQKRLVCALCLRLDNKDNLYVRTEDNREDKVASSKVVFSSRDQMSPTSPPEQIVSMLRVATSSREEIAAQVQLEEVWELLVEEDETCTLESLGELVFGSDPSGEQLSGLYRALAADKTWFVRKGNDYRPRPREQVEETMTRLRAEADKVQERAEIGRWIRAVWDDLSPEPPAAFERAATRYLTWIREVALFASEAPRFKDIQKLFKELEISGKDAAFRLMVKSGQWTEDENLLLHRFHTPIEFSPEILAEAERVARGPAPNAGLQRRDLRDLPCFTVDDADTTEIDDALSLELLEGGHLRVGIHIADASAWLEPGTPLDEEARGRGTAIYLPEKKIRMLPEALGDGACSLVAGQDRLAFSFLVDFDDQGNLLESWMGPSTIHVVRRYTYTEADNELSGSPPAAWAPLLELARKLRSAREQAGAVTLPFPRTTVKVGPEQKITIEKDSPTAPSQVVVSELMILANRLSGEYLAAQGAPGLFRSQPPPDKQIPPDTEFTPEVLYRLRRFFRKGELGLTPARHNGLGLEAYTQATSPIRRYSDLAMQRQLKSLLAGGTPFYSAEELETIRQELERLASNADSLEKDRRAYWTLKYLEKHQWDEFDGVVLQNLPDKHIVQLTDVLWETDCPLIPGHPLPPGSRLKLRLELVWPREQTVRVSPVREDEKE